MDKLSGEINKTSEIAMCANARTNRKCINGYSMSMCKYLIEKQKIIRMKICKNHLSKISQSIIYRQKYCTRRKMQAV